MKIDLYPVHDYPGTSKRISTLENLPVPMKGTVLHIMNSREQRWFEVDKVFFVVYENDPTANHIDVTVRPFVTPGSRGW